MQRFQLAALVHSAGRRQARRWLATGEPAERLLARVDGARLDPHRLYRACKRSGIRLLLSTDDDYPPLLAAVADPPPVLYLRGDPAAWLRPTVALVGARRCTRAGADVAGQLAAGLAACGITVVSGLARGIDTAAHRVANDNGVTVAVVGSGLARPYPAANSGLADAIVSGGGALLSEYPPEASARRHHFPERNRLISGLCRGVVVVEAGEHSGSLITARLALEQGREVAAVPGSVLNPGSRGCHRLLREGAALVESATDVLEAFGLPASPAAAPAADESAPDAAAGLAALLAVVEDSLTTLDQVVAATGLSAAAAGAALVELELGGFVRQVPGGYIRRPRR